MTSEAVWRLPFCRRRSIGPLPSCSLNGATGRFSGQYRGRFPSLKALLNRLLPVLRVDDGLDGRAEDLDAVALEDALAVEGDAAVQRGLRDDSIALFYARKMD